jgi:TRAP-type C4-dicarboxylate transport system substrate-binding protein
MQKSNQWARQVEVYPNSQLYEDKEQLEALQLGAIHMLALSLAKFGPLRARSSKYSISRIFFDHSGTPSHHRRGDGRGVTQGHLE